MAEAPESKKKDTWALELWFRTCALSLYLILLAKANNIVESLDLEVAKKYIYIDGKRHEYKDERQIGIGLQFTTVIFSLPQDSKSITLEAMSSLK